MTSIPTWGDHMTLMIRALSEVAKKCPSSVEIRDEVIPIGGSFSIREDRFRRMTITVEWIS